MMLAQLTFSLLTISAAGAENVVRRHQATVSAEGLQTPITSDSNASVSGRVFVSGNKSTNETFRECHRRRRSFCPECINHHQKCVPGNKCAENRTFLLGSGEDVNCSASNSLCTVDEASGEQTTCEDVPGPLGPENRRRGYGKYYWKQVYLAW
mmetsp:Transcript_6898/g.12194  ORF Transcript_6898/g.12194 Transcript_6898/m.12194 type:complete len:153 (-) Transcript_6898:60-518(-)